MQNREKREQILNNLFFGGDNKNLSIAAARTEETFLNAWNVFKLLRDLIRFGDDLDLSKYIDKIHAATKELANSLVFMDDFIHQGQNPEE